MYKEYTKEERYNIYHQAFELTTHHSDSMEQYNRDRAQVMLVRAIDALNLMDQLEEDYSNNYGAMWEKLKDEFTFDIKYYLDSCKTLQRSDTIGS